ncbi:MAG: hypothetical protein PHQ62_00735 [Clostridia bacterium]|nr:hypothetical protein [Clostridia bacterium]
MKKVVYFILGIASLVVLLGMAYIGLAFALGLPTINFLLPLAYLYPTFTSLQGIIVSLPVIIMTVFALTYFFEKGIKILFLILTILSIVAIILVLLGVFATV